LAAELPRNGVSLYTYTIRKEEEEEEEEGLLEVKTDGHEFAFSSVAIAFGSAPFVR
jgi:hypothetical protein